MKKQLANESTGVRAGCGDNRIGFEGKDGGLLFEGDNLLNQIVNISKAAAYDVTVEQVKAQAEQVKELQAENKALKDVLKQFIHAVEHEGVVEGPVVDAVKNGATILKILKF